MSPWNGVIQDSFDHGSHSTSNVLGSPTHTFDSRQPHPNIGSRQLRPHVGSRQPHPYIGSRQPRPHIGSRQPHRHIGSRQPHPHVGSKATPTSILSHPHAEVTSPVQRADKKTLRNWLSSFDCLIRSWYLVFHAGILCFAIAFFLIRKVAM